MNFSVFLGRAWRYANRRISRFYMDAAFPRTDHPMERLGSVENGWYAPTDLPQGARCYCVGVGYDATFDFALAERGADVFSFDPTPHAVGYMEEQNQGRVTFKPWGMFDADKTIRLYFPLSEEHGSYFAQDLHNTGKYHEVPCYRLTTVLDRLGHDDVHLMKIDIEGSWYEVLSDMLTTEDRLPDFLEVEFDSPAPVWRVAPIARLLRKSGYRLILREADNGIFKRVVSQ